MCVCVYVCGAAVFEALAPFDIKAATWETCVCERECVYVCMSVGDVYASVYCLTGRQLPGKPV